MLTPRKERFALEYAVDLNATQAAIRAGYSPHTAYSLGQRLLKDADVSRIIAASQLATFERVAGSADWIVQQAVRVVQYALDDEPRDLRAAVPALTLLAKRHPEFSEKHDINANVRLQALSVVANMTEEQLLALAGEPITTSSKPGDNGYELRNRSSAQSLALHNGEA